MSITIESDLKEILVKLEQKIDRLAEEMNNRFDKVDERFNKVDERFDKVDVRLQKVELSIVRLEEKTGGLSQRIDSQEFVNRGVLIGLIVAILGGAAKLLGLVGNP